MNKHDPLPAAATAVVLGGSLSTQLMFMGIAALILLVIALVLRLGWRRRKLVNDR